MSLEEFIAAHYSAGSVRRYLQQIQQYQNYQGEKAETASYQDVLNYIQFLRQKELHPKTVKNHLFAIKIYYKYLLEQGIREDHPCQHLNLKDQYQRQIKLDQLYSREELEKMYQDFENYQYESKTIKTRDKLIVSLLIDQALTSSEITNLQVQDIDLEQGQIHIREQDHPGRRGNKARTLALKSRQILLIDKYLKKQRKKLLMQAEKATDYLILNESGNKLWKSHLNRMLLRIYPDQHYTPLRIRQSVIANLLKENKDLRVVQAFAGHRRTGSTEAYRQTGLEELRAGIEKWHPR